MASASFEFFKVQGPKCEEVSLVTGRTNLLHSLPESLNDALWITGTVFSFLLQFCEGLIFESHFKSHEQIIGGAGLLSSTVFTFS